MLTDKKNIISQLRKQILHLEGFKSVSDFSPIPGLQSIERAFPNHIFPTGTLHEFVASGEHPSACLGFMSSLLSALMQQEGICLWISTTRNIYPLGLSSLGVIPHRIIFIDLQREKDVLWATEEALKCEGVCAVVSELREISFAQSRRLQLATEKSGVTGFILIKDNKRLNATPCTARWRIKSLQSEAISGLPGVGFSRWQVELLKVRNGNPTKWEFEWRPEGLVAITTNKSKKEIPVKHRKVG